MKSKRRKLKVGDEVMWDCAGDARKGRRGQLLAPCRVVSVEGSKANVEGPSMLGLTWKRRVPLAELVKVTAVALVVLLNAGCFITGSPKRNFPSDIKSMCHHALKESKTHLKDCDSSLRLKEYDLTIRKVRGEKRFSSGWAWRAPEHKGMWVHGLCYGSLIKTSCNPQTGGEVQYRTLHHECGHHWLMKLGIRNHPKRFDKHFRWSWIDRNMARAREVSLQGTDPNGVPYHIDFFVDEDYDHDAIRTMDMTWDKVKTIIFADEWVTVTVPEPKWEE